MRVIFLGCGYLGYNLSRLLSADFAVEMWGIDSPYVSRQSDFHYVDVFDQAAMAAMDMRDAVVVDTVALVANNARDNNEVAALSRLQEQYDHLLSSLKAGGTGLFVFFSSGGTVYGEIGHPAEEIDPLSPQTLYARSKVLEEEMIRASGIPYLILRVANPYGGYQIAGKRQGVIPVLIRKALTGETFELWNSEDSRRDYIYIDDLAAAIRLLLKNDVRNETVNVSAGSGTSLQQLMTAVEQETGSRLEIMRMVSDVPVVQDNVLNIAKLKRLTGFAAQVSITEGIRRETERIREELK
ncbi:MAG: NAD-dependent epimerase/dehydratase family protein [Solobacterium sp.]|nr:NAD-dependent epimerase/dehydratase family protein [Solobacterium sp.]